MANFIVSRLYKESWIEEEIIEADDFSQAKKIYQLRHGGSFGNIKAQEVGVCAGCGENRICKKFINPKTQVLENCCDDCIRKIMVEIQARGLN